jgi:hypothetical protein
MNKRIVSWVVGLCLAGGLAVAAYGQGMYWEATRSGGMMGDKTETDKMYYMPGMFKMETGGDEGAVIIRLDKEVMYNLDVKNKTYSEMTFAELEKMSKKASAKMDEAMSRMQKQMEGMSEEQRKMVEQMMKGKMPGKGAKPAKVDVVKTGETRTISGYPCAKYVVKEGGGEIVTLWVTKEVKGFESMRKDMEEFEKRMAAMDPRGAEGMEAAMKAIDGFPIQTEMPGGMDEVVTKIERRSTREDAFEVPAGYKKVNPPMMPEEKEEQEAPETQ